KGKPSSIAQGCENIWRFDEVQSTALRMYAFDFSGQFSPLAPGQKPPMVPVGSFTKTKYGGGPFAVPPRHTLKDAEVLPEALIGNPLGGLSAAQRLTFKVVRSVAEVECLGFLDSLNAYDTALLSLGLCHWTLGLNSQVTQAELAAYLSYLQYAEPAAFQKAL